MKKVLIDYSILLIFIATLSFLSACQKSSTTEPDPTTKSMTDLLINSDFDWSTTQSIQMRVTVLDNQNQPMEAVKFMIYTAHPDSSGKLITSGVTDNTGVYNIDYNIPAYYTQLYVSTEYLGLPNPGWVEIGPTGFDLHLGGKQSPSAFKSLADNQGINANYKYLGGYNSLGVPDYLEAENDPISQDLLTTINNTLPSGVRLPNYKPEYFEQNISHNVELLDFSDVWVTFVHEGAGYRNVLGFYSYNINNPPATPDDIDSITVIFPNASYAGSGGGLHSGNKVHLGQFPGGTVIGFALMANGWKNGQVTDGNWIVYSEPNLNPEADPNKRQHTVLLADNAHDLLLLGIEDIRRDNGGCDHDFNDAVFYVTASPLQNVNQVDLPTVDYTGTDTDGDDIPDNFDDYPDDPDRAFNNYYFNEGDFGTLAFEDMWPEMGDYDFNDAVIDYNYNQITNGENKVVEVHATYILRAQGAYFHNGFGVELPIANNLVAEVSGELNVPGDIVSLDSRNMEEGQSKAVIIVWEDGYDVLPHPGSGIGVNTQTEAPFVTPDTLDIVIKFTQPIGLSELGNPPYNPFIFADGQRGTEIHLVNKPPTDLADLTLFGTASDDSDGTSNRYYKTSGNLPWGIHIIERFDYPVEKVEILDAHLKFGTWAESNGQLFYDWFRNESGYRNTGNIYQPPSQ